MGLPRESVKPFDPDTPSVARVWDYWLGGNNNFPADRELAEKMLEINPLAAQMAQENRQFLGRAVSYVARRGVRQFIDIGAGLPPRRPLMTASSKPTRARKWPTSTTIRS